MKTILPLIIAIAGVFVVSVPAQAQTVGVQFVQTYNGYAVNPLNLGANNYTAGVVQQQNWNVADGVGIVGPGQYGNITTFSGSLSNANLVTTSYDSSYNVVTSSTTLIDSTGAASNILFNYNIGNNINHKNNDGTSSKNLGGGGHWANPNWNTVGGVTDVYLAQGVVYSDDASLTPTLTLSNLNANDSYTLIAYVGSPNWMAGINLSISMNSTTYYLTTDNGTLSGFTQSTSTDSSVSPMADYVEFTGLTGSDIETLTINGVGGGLDGFQLIDTGAVPEPTTLGLIAAGVMGLAVQLGRKRRSMI